MNATDRDNVFGMFALLREEQRLAIRDVQDAAYDGDAPDLLTRVRESLVRLDRANDALETLTDCVAECIREAFVGGNTSAFKLLALMEARGGNVDYLKGEALAEIEELDF